MNKYKSVVLYTMELCGDCRQMKRFLESNNITYESRDIQKNPSCREELLKNAGEIAVPYMVLDGTWVMGYPDGYCFTEEYAKNLFGIK